MCLIISKELFKFLESIIGKLEVFNLKWLAILILNLPHFNLRIKTKINK